MTEEDDRRALKKLDARLRRARRAPDGGRSGSAARLAGAPLGLAIRVSVEMVASFLVAGGIGLLLDRWLGTKPWLLLVFLLLGGAAGVMSVYRTSRQVARQAENGADGDSPDGES